MNGFTSGTQALQGRKVNHDPEPWVDLAHGNRHSETDLGAYAGMVFPVPRRRFDVLDNPILAEFRISFGNAKTLPVTAWPNAKPDAVIQVWLRWVDDPSASSEDPEPWTAVQRSHAMRVLTKLAALNA